MTERLFDEVKVMSKLNAIYAKLEKLEESSRRGDKPKIAKSIKVAMVHVDTARDLIVGNIK